MRIALKIFLALYGLAFIVFAVSDPDAGAPQCAPGGFQGWNESIQSACSHHNEWVGIPVGIALVFAAWFIRPRFPRRNSPTNSRSQ